ncbi:unnamed protein product [Anisakis simplex]|uniref:Cytokin_check_N domain-containing protein n=1 Tax=Anisakis simplex TaxID=6269 RepID=A0A0M3KEP5_ANISI|nr:unnamed protein product [Anisakis simplex]
MDMANQFIVELDLKRSMLYTMHRFLKNLLSECSFDLLFRPERVEPKWIEFDRDHRRQTWLDSFSVDGDLLMFTESLREQNAITSNIYATNMQQPKSTVHILIVNFATDLILLKKSTIVELTARNVSTFDKLLFQKASQKASARESSTKRPQYATKNTIWTYKPYLGAYPSIAKQQSTTTTAPHQKTPAKTRQPSTATGTRDWLDATTTTTTTSPPGDVERKPLTDEVSYRRPSGTQPSITASFTRNTPRYSSTRNIPKENDHEESGRSGAEMGSITIDEIDEDQARSIPSNGDKALQGKDFESVERPSNADFDANNDNDKSESRTPKDRHSLMEDQYSANDKPKDKWNDLDNTDVDHYNDGEDELEDGIYGISDDFSNESGPRPRPTKHPRQNTGEPQSPPQNETLKSVAAKHYSHIVSFDNQIFRIFLLFFVSLQMMHY